MPTADYKCSNCDLTIEHYFELNENEQDKQTRENNYKCPSCNSPLKRVFMFGGYFWNTTGGTR